MVLITKYVAIAVMMVDVTLMVTYVMLIRLIVSTEKAPTTINIVMRCGMVMMRIDEYK